MATEAPELVLPTPPAPVSQPATSATENGVHDSAEVSATRTKTRKMRTKTKTEKASAVAVDSNLPSNVADLLAIVVKRLANVEEQLADATLREDFYMRVIANPALLAGTSPNVASLRVLAPSEVRFAFAYLRHQRIYTRVDVSYCTLQRGDVKALADMLATTTIIEELDLSGCGLNAEDALVLAGGLAQNKSLQTLNLYSNNLGDDGVKALLQGVSRDSTLVSLILSKCNVTATGCTAIAEFLAATTTLQALSLKRNRLGSDGVAALVAGVTRNAAPKLKKLSLHDVGMGAEGLTALTSLLPRRVITELNISNNPGIDTANLQAFCTAAETTDHLTMLNMLGNKMGDDGIAAVAALLRRTKALGELDIRHNNITDAGGNVLVAALAENRSLTSIHHHGNNFSVVFQATLSALLKARKIDDADSDEGASSRANGTNRRPSLLKRLSLKDMIGAGPSSPPAASK